MLLNVMLEDWILFLSLSISKCFPPEESKTDISFHLSILICWRCTAD